ncbi:MULTISPECIES: flavin reductase family protein [Streptomyces]|uniref:Flavin reductase n=1 Tax=Streptomyces pseudovenezuelae TaxID=67350 RepID=A0A101N1L9_9ACTN|nr:MULTISPECIES: flavin reductase family protein [Streptomyces]KUM84885.1 flavin reductase [Streptomyces pseudovenezuelae]
MTAISTTSSSDADYLARMFRDAMAQVVTPVTVVTGIQEGVPHGTTVSAFTSLSLSPPMVLVSLDRTSELLSIVGRSGRFGVNVLGSAHSDVALRFARKGGAAKFADTRWLLDHRLPRLPNALGWLACEIEQMVDGGDHVVLLGKVLHTDQHDGSPLTYHARTFGTHTRLDRDP